MSDQYIKFKESLDLVEFTWPATLISIKTIGLFGFDGVAINDDTMKSLSSDDTGVH